MLASFLPENPTAIMICLAAFVAAVWPYVKAIKSKDEPTLGSYLSFLSVYALAAGLFFTLAVTTVSALNWSEQLNAWPVALAFLAFVLVPPFVLATAAIRVRINEPRLR